MSFIEEVIRWYKENKRDLPWRNTNDPYIIWLSEIILQQTRVDQGMPYFQRFAERFPDVSAFASAAEEEILKLWQGLGYYSRGRNMHFTAKTIVNEFDGRFPRAYNDLIELKGIGEYTAAAISSFSSNEVRAVVDGNVYRLLSRYFGITEPVNTSKAKVLFTNLANELIDKENPGLSNQAMMEFGSLQCRPKKPDCLVCPLCLSCEARRTGKVDQLPVKARKAPVRDRYFHYIIAFKDDTVFLNKRGPNDIWQHLYEFPLIESDAPRGENDPLISDELKRLFGSSTTIRFEHGPVKHVLSHQRIHARFIWIENFSETGINAPWFYSKTSAIENYPMPKLIFAFLKMFPNLNPNSYI